MPQPKADALDESRHRPPAQKNLEFKGKVKEPASLEKAFKDNGAAFVESLKQTDTYFAVSKGRLKLREARDKKPELIFYERDETSAAGMESLYSVLPLPDLSMKDVLVKALGVKVVVEKERRLLKLKNARIHLDEVKNLGSFLEFEVVSDGDDIGNAFLLNELKKLAAPYVEEEINLSYSDLMLSDQSLGSY